MLVKHKHCQTLREKQEKLLDTTEEEIVESSAGRIQKADLKKDFQENEEWIVGKTESGKNVKRQEVRQNDRREGDKFAAKGEVARTTKSGSQTSERDAERLSAEVEN